MNSQQAISIQTLRSSLCQSLIAAGKTSATEIINEAKALEEYVFGNKASNEVVTINTKAKENTVVGSTVSKTETQTVAIEQPVEEVQVEQTTEQATAPTAEEVKAILMSVAKKNRDALMQILKNFSATKVSDLKEEDYSSVYAAAEQALETNNA